MASLGHAQGLLQEAKDELVEFADEHPERMDSTIASATDMAASAADKLDCDYYVTHNAESGHNE